MMYIAWFPLMMGSWWCIFWWIYGSLRDCCWLRMVDHGCNLVARYLSMVEERFLVTMCVHGHQFVSRGGCSSSKQILRSEKGLAQDKDVCPQIIQYIYSSKPSDIWGSLFEKPSNENGYVRKGGKRIDDRSSGILPRVEMKLSWTDWEKAARGNNGIDSGNWLDSHNRDTQKPVE